MVFSTNKMHIDENLESTDFVMSDEDYQNLTKARPIEIDSSVINWDGNNLGLEIVPFANDLKN